MNPAAASPPATLGIPAQSAILLVNLGTPAAPTASALRRYLAEFLWDRRVVDLPRLPWWLILHGIILRTRPAKSAAKYAQIWTQEGSPLALHTERQAKLLTGLLGHKGYRGQHHIAVSWAMRYGSPSIASRLDELQAAGMAHVLILPLYPQFAHSTTSSVHDAVAAWQRRQPPGRSQPMQLHLAPSFADHPAYIEALAALVRRHWQREGRSQSDERMLLMSFHGIPQRSVDRGDPYQRDCERTAAALARQLQLEPSQWRLSYQSRFGRAAWLRPYTQQTLEQLAASGCHTVDVICPGFVADCLETLEEINMENRAAYLQAGGREFHYIPCLNEEPLWIEALADISLARLHAPAPASK